MKIHVFQLGQIGTNAYLVFPDNSTEAVLFDCPLEAATDIPEFLAHAGRTLSAILLTHGHWDHIWDAAALAEKTGAKIYASHLGKPLIEDADFQREVMFADDGLKSAHIDVPVRDGDILRIAGLEIKCFEVPGHSPDSIAYYVEKEGIVFSGDVLFLGSIGRTDLWEGSFAQLEKSVKRKLYALPDSTKVLTGHGAPTTIGAEKSSNPYIGG